MRGLWKTFMLVSLVGIYSESPAQFNQSWYHPQFNPFSTCTPPSAHAQKIFSEALRNSRLYASIPLLHFCQNDFIPNAYAQVYGFPSIYRIDYNPNFFGQADITVNNEFAIIGIFAHEIGHIEHFSHIGNPRNPQSWKAYFDLTIPWEKELRADEFAGFVLGKMGATVKDVVDTQRTIFSLHVNPQYANSETRLRRMFKGYLAAKQGDLSEEEIADLTKSHQNLAMQYLRWR